MPANTKIGNVALLCGSVFLALIVGLKCTHAGEHSPERALGEFFDVYPMVRGSGLSWGKEPVRLTAVISSSLQGLLEQAGKAEASIWRLHPQESWGVEGDLWTSLFEGADRYAIGPCHIAEKQATCDVRLNYGEPPNAVDWTDQYVLIQINGRWAVDDVRWGGDWSFMHKGTLRNLLTSEITEAARMVGSAPRPSGKR